MKTEKSDQKQSSVRPVSSKKILVSKKEEESNPVEEVKEEVLETPIVEEVKPIEVVNSSPKAVEPPKPKAEPKVSVQGEKLDGARVDIEPSIQLKNIVRVLRKSPTVTEVLLKSGDSVQLSTSDYERLRNPQDPTSIIKHL